MSDTPSAPTAEQVARRLRSQAAHDGNEFPSGGEPPCASHAALMRDAASLLDSLTAEHARLREALEGLLGVSTREELEGMEFAIRASVASAEDKASALNAIHALLALTRTPQEDRTCTTP